MKITGGKSTRAVTATREKNTKTTKKKKKGVNPLGVIAVILVLAVVAVGAVGFIAQSGDKIYPNVSFAGVELGGMTQAEAVTELQSGGYEAELASAIAQIRLPNGDSFSISANDAGLSLTATEAAAEAYAYGRDGGAIARIIAYYKCMLGSDAEVGAAGIGDATMPELPAVRETVHDAVTRLNLALGDDTFVIGEEEISILKSSDSVLADENAVYSLTLNTLRDAIASGSVATANYDLPDHSDSFEIDLVAIYNTINVAPVEAAYDAETKTVTESVTGVSFDMAAAQRLVDAADFGSYIRIPLIKVLPEVTSESLRELLFRDVLSERTTYIDGTSNRLTNITLAAAAVDGLILNPGEEFSFNGTVGERTTAKGYKTAGAYSGGRTVQETGGGICQVSSTIYDCVLHADLEVTDRRNHQFVVSYLPLGNDATVNWGTTDFKFKNNTEYPIQIDTEVDGRNLTVKLIGTKFDTNYIKVQYETLSTRGFSTIEVEDESIEPGKQKVDTSGHSGATVETYKYRYKEDGTLIDKTFIARSTYNAQNRIILVAPGSLGGEGGEVTGDPLVTDDPVTPPEDTTDPTDPTDNPYIPPEVTPEPIDPPTETPIETPPPVSPNPDDSAAALPDPESIV